MRKIVVIGGPIITKPYRKYYGRPVNKLGI
jgi:hypothetical protein